MVIGNAGDPRHLLRPVRRRRAQADDDRRQRRADDRRRGALLAGAGHQAGGLRLRHLRRRAIPSTAPWMLTTVCAAVAARTSTFPLAPALITQGAAGAPDQIAVLYGNTDLIVAGKTFTFSSNSIQGHVVDSGWTHRPASGRRASSSPVRWRSVGTHLSTDRGHRKHERGRRNHRPRHGQLHAAERRWKQSPPATTRRPVRLSRTASSTSSAPPRDAISGRFRTARLVVQDDMHWSDADADGTNDPVAVYDDIIDLQAEYGVAEDSNGDGALDSIGSWTTPPRRTWPPSTRSASAFSRAADRRRKSKVTTTAPPGLVAPSR